MLILKTILEINNIIVTSYYANALSML